MGGPGGGGQPLGSGRQLPPQLTVGRRPLGGEGGFRGGDWGGGGSGRVGWGGGSRWGNLGCCGGGGGRLRLPPLALPLTIPSP